MTETEDNVNVDDIRMEDDEDIMVHDEGNHGSIKNDKIHDDNQLVKNKKSASMSFKDADKQRQSIKSVTQKLKRETIITNIPYHKSKIFSLKEFMSRKTVVKSKHILKQINNQELLYVAKPKMDCNQLEKYSKYLEKRAKEIKSTTEIITKDKNDENGLKSDGDSDHDEEMQYSDSITKTDKNFPKLTNFEIEKDETEPTEINLDDKKSITKSFSISEIAKISNTRKKCEEKPENSRIKLKKQLKRLIAQKREIEIKKKIENKFKEDKTEKNEEYDDGDYDYDGEDEEDEEDNFSEVENDKEKSNENMKNCDDMEKIIDENNEQDVEIENDKNDEINTEEESLGDIDINIPTLSPSPSYKQKNIINDNVLMSQIPKNTQTLGEDDEDELANLCSGTFSMSAKKDDESSNCRNLESSSEDENYDDISSKKNPRKRLVISDDSASDDNDSDDDESKAVKSEHTEKNQSETDEEECETYIDYDSEENEIEVKLTKNECLKKAEDFLENEAELSESEWNSADEDEKDLDKYDIELGDEDDFDAAKLRDEIGKIHMRKILDEDIREVKKIKEMIFDDEENDGIGRQRQFKWSVNHNDFSLVGNNDQTELAEEVNENEDEQEKFCRKIRYEREQLLKEKMENQIQKETETKLELQGIGKKLTIMSKTKSCIQSDNCSSKKLESSFLITRIEKKVTRRSFLERDQEILPKLCSLTNNEVEDDEISHKKSTSKYRNFVFPVLSGDSGQI